MLGNTREVSFTNLDPGDYTLYVKAANKDGFWNAEGASIYLIITPPWYETWWAYLFYVCALFVLIYVLWSYELRRQRLRGEALRLQELDRFKSRFFANISHEFRTPLTLILGPLKDLVDGKSNGDTSEQYETMMRNGQRLLKLIDDILNISRLEAGKLALTAQLVEINGLIRRIIASFKSHADSKEINLKFRPAAEAIEVFVDIDKMETILYNLLGNALKFTPTKGRVILELGLAALKNDLNPKSEIRNPQSQIGDHVAISIQDTGPGIPPDQLIHVFDRFQQGENGYAKDDIVGSGIGLALTKELVELHQGKITVDSELHKGSTFTIYLPLGKNHLSPSEIIEKETQISRSLEKRIEGILEGSSRTSDFRKDNSKAAASKLPKLLIVEDNADMRAYIKQQFSLHYQILEAENGAEGLKRIRKEYPDLVISDVMMPEMDGNELCRRIKEDEAISHTPVILLTAKAGEEAQVEGLGFGADIYLEKPFNAEILRLTVKNLLGQQRRIQQYLKDNWPVLPENVDKLKIGVRDREFLDKVTGIVYQYMADESFDISRLAKECGYSKTQLNRKLQKLTDTDSTTFLRTLRLRKAKQLLVEGQGNVTEVALQVGFNNFSYFARKFKEAFGTSPSTFLKN